MLAGALDGIVAAGGDAAKWRDGLLRHPLASLIGDLSSGSKLAHGHTIAENGVGADALSASIADLGFSRALAARHDLAVDAVRKAWAAGQSIWLADAASDALLEDLDGRNTDNITSSLQKWDGGEDKPFDLIVAIGTVEDLSQSALEARLRTIRAATAPTGTVLLSSFVPGHSGQGWQMICNGTRSYCQDEAAMRRMAIQAGFEITHYRDASNSLVWAILRPLDGEKSAGGLENG